MPKITRVGVTFPPDLLEDFDKMIQKMGYDSRSKAIQDAVRLLISERKWLHEDEGSIQTGIVLMVYDHEVKGLEEELTEEQHLFSSIVSSTLHIHVGKQDCLEAIAVKGKASEIRKLSEKLATKRGVKILKTMIATI